MTCTPPSDQHSGRSHQAGSDSAWAATSLATLGLPEPPSALRNQVRQLAGTRAGSRDRAPGLASVGHFTDEARRRTVDDYVLAGIEDVSIDLDGLYFHVVYDRLAVFSQTILSGGQVTPKGRYLYENYAELNSVLQTPVAAYLLPAPGRMLVADFELGPHEWTWSGSEPSEGLGGIAGALAFVRSLVGIT